MTKPDSLLKISLDELRMQMLGAQVVFGFQFQSVFQDRLDISDRIIQAAALLGMGCMALTMGTLIAAPAVHRIASGGGASRQMRMLTSTLARIALLMLAGGLAATVFVTIDTEFGLRAALAAALLMAALSVAAWHFWGMLLRSPSRPPKEAHTMAQSHASLHHRIDFALTEARVMLPGAQALFGFQLLVPLMKAFETLPTAARVVHFAALSCIALTIVLLISPAAIHRIAFAGADDERFLRMSSAIVTVALVPLALGVAGELYVATARLLPDSSASLWIAAGAVCTLLGLWYALPLALRVRRSEGRWRTQT
jgi:hypothetical protein